MKLSLLAGLLLSEFALGDWVNRTIDDQLGDEVTGLQVGYAPPGYWSQGNGCDHCAFHPDNTSAHDGTWHDGTRVPANDIEPLSFTLKFNGTAIYIFNIATRLTLTDVNFTLDGVLFGRYTQFYNVSDQEQYIYNVPILSLPSIPYGDHTLVVDAFGPNQTLVLFDYAIYTTNSSASDQQSLPITSVTPMTTSPPAPTSGASAQNSPGANGVSSSSHKSNAGAIAGGVVGGLAVLALALLAVIFFFRRRPKRVSSVAKSGLVLPDDALPEDGDDKHPSPFRIFQDPNTPPTNNTPSTLDLDGAKESTEASRAGSSALVSSLPSDSTSLRDQVNTLRAELEAIRAAASPLTSPTRSSNRTPSALSSPLRGELDSLRAEVAELRARQDRKRATVSVAAPSPTQDQGNLMRELAVLRGEMEEIRMQQDISHLGDLLPRYSPPPPSDAFSQVPIPSSPGVVPRHF